jgi:hypothetical protein
MNKPSFLPGACLLAGALLLLPLAADAQLAGKRWTAAGRVSFARIYEGQTYGFAASLPAGIVLARRVVAGVRPELNGRLRLDSAASQLAPRQSVNLGLSGETRLYLSPLENRLNFFFELSGGYALSKEEQTLSSPPQTRRIRYAGFRWGSGLGLSYWLLPQVSLDGRLYGLSRLRQDPESRFSLNLGGSLSFWFGELGGNRYAFPFTCQAFRGAAFLW